MAVLVAVTTAGLGGCSGNAYGVAVLNKTGQRLDVQYMDVLSDGSTKSFATSALPKGGTFNFQVTDDERGFGKRVSFALPERSPDDPTGRVELKLSDMQVRNYELMLVNGRLQAKEMERVRVDDQPREADR
jgi:hypothetical protein